MTTKSMTTKSINNQKEFMEAMLAGETVVDIKWSKQVSNTDILTWKLVNNTIVSSKPLHHIIPYDYTALSILATTDKVTLTKEVRQGTTMLQIIPLTNHLEHTGVDIMTNFTVIEICTLNGTKWILGDEATEPMTWSDAKAWCESIGQELPAREVLMMAYINLETRRSFANDLYWSSSEDDSNGAWIQDFYNGYQDYDCKDFTLSVRAVRAIEMEKTTHTT